MEKYIYEAGECKLMVWGLTPFERACRILKGIAVPVKYFDEIPEGASVMMIRGDYLVDDRLIKYLAHTHNIIVCTTSSSGRRVPFAAHVNKKNAGATEKFLLGCGAPPGGVEIRETATLPVSFNMKLRKHEPPFVLKVEEGNEKEREKELFNWSYKGVTDLVTKWLWPAPARRVVRLCVKAGLSPNHVTFAGFLLVILAGYCFYKGNFWLGLAAGWLMTFLDTVDGKLARVTVQSSRFGHYFDHVIDLVHPPFWYLLWGIGLKATGEYGVNIPLSTLMCMIFAGYIAGRLVEGCFKRCIARFGIFCWRPVDSFFRLIMARRNPCLILLTMSMLGGRPDIGLVAVAFWTVISTLFMGVRLCMAFYDKIRGREVTSWFSGIDAGKEKNALAIRWFARKVES